MRHPPTNVASGRIYPVTDTDEAYDEARVPCHVGSNSLNCIATARTIFLMISADPEHVHVLGNGADIFRSSRATSTTSIPTFLNFRTSAMLPDG